jgi:hypothetical protein
MKKTIRTKTANMPPVPDSQDPLLKVLKKFKKGIKDVNWLNRGNLDMKLGKKWEFNIFLVRRARTNMTGLARV